MGYLLPVADFLDCHVVAEPEHAVLRDLGKGKIGWAYWELVDFVSDHGYQGRDAI